MPQKATITSLPEAMEIVKEMRVHDNEWNMSDWRLEANRVVPDKGGLRKLEEERDRCESFATKLA